MKIVAAGCCTRKWLRHQTIRNLTSGDMATLLAMTGLGVTGMEKIRLVYLLDLFEGKREMGQCDLVCVERLWIFGLMLVMLISNSRVVSVVLVLSAVGLHRLNFLLSSLS